MSENENLTTDKEILVRIFNGCTVKSELFHDNAVDMSAEEESENINQSCPAAIMQDESDDSCDRLQIDLSESSAKKRKRNHSDRLSDIDSEIEEEIDVQLKSTARRANLTKANVKSILKHIITNESILALVKKSMESDFENTPSESEDNNVEPKITRSKAKELFHTQPPSTWLLSPIKKPSEQQQHLVLINQELPEDDDDEEYKPTDDDLQDYQSEDESGRLSVVSTMSHTSTQLTSLHHDSFTDVLPIDMNSSVDETLFKMPEENIYQRTRSKLCLTDTPLETIEQAFVPPDITTDMYEFDCDNEDWTNFLKEFMQPLTNDDDDDEADPEYNVLAEEEVVDSEELRRDRAVNITRKELRNLMAEVFESPDEVSSDEEKEQRVKNEITESYKLEDTTSEMQILVEEEEEELEEEEEDIEEEEEQEVKMGMTKDQILLLEQQLRQHVQLTTFHFVQVYKHPLFNQHAQDLKIILTSLYELSKMKGKDSLFSIYNLELAIKFIEDWQNYVDNRKTGKAVIRHMENEVQKAVAAKSYKSFHRVQFHEELMKRVLNSKVFIYTLLLPQFGFRCDNPISVDFSRSEDHLIALGLEQFIEYLKENPRWFDKKKHSEKAAIEMTCEYLVPVKKPETIARHIRNVKSIEDNPIAFYRKHGRAPPTVHYVVPFVEDNVPTPSQQPEHLLQGYWKLYMQSLSKDENKENSKYMNSTSSCT